MHHSEERYLELLDCFGVTETYHLTSLTVSSGVTEPYHLTLLDSFTWRYWTVSPDVTGQFYLALLNCITWCYWTVSLGVTGPYHLTLLDSFTCHYWTYWTVSPCVTETYSYQTSFGQKYDHFSLLCKQMDIYLIKVYIARKVTSAPTFSA